jgi:hypothetical protein
MGGEGILSPGQLPDVVARETRLPGAMTASAATRKALAPVGATYTAFTGELIAVLRDRHRWTRTPRHERPLHRADPPNETAPARPHAPLRLSRHRRPNRPRPQPRLHTAAIGPHRPCLRGRGRAAPAARPGGPGGPIVRRGRPRGGGTELPESTRPLRGRAEPPRADQRADHPRQGGAGERRPRRWHGAPRPCARWPSSSATGSRKRIP